MNRLLLNCFINTAPLGFEHPFLKYYFITGAPYLFLVNKNGILMHPADPRSDKGADLINLIKKDIAE
jgi:hypothetical protein